MLVELFEDLALWMAGNFLLYAMFLLPLDTYVVPIRTLVASLLTSTANLTVLQLEVSPTDYTPLDAFVRHIPALRALKLTEVTKPGLAAPASQRRCWKDANAWGKKLHHLPHLGDFALHTCLPFTRIPGNTDQERAVIGFWGGHELPHPNLQRIVSELGNFDRCVWNPHIGTLSHYDAIPRLKGLGAGHCSSSHWTLLTSSYSTLAKTAPEFPSTDLVFDIEAASASSVEENNNTWRVLSPATPSSKPGQAPVPRVGATFNYDAHSDSLYLWGGQGGVDLSPLNHFQLGIFKASVRDQTLRDIEQLIWEDLSLPATSPMRYKL
ncbi:hypothetical protein EDD15DRAFT_2428870 [Pisolithus albus]|nr:hypothetical protein EDD15DRAFT_2428870 [Pisolithus albus]